MPEDDEIARLRAAVDDLAARVSRLESSRIPLPLAEPKPSGAGLKTINRLGALTLAIGVIFFFKYAVDEKLIGASAGVFLGVVLGCALLGGGEWLIGRGERVFAQGVSGCGLAVIYISFYAAFAFYKILAEAAGFALLTGVSAAAVFLAIRYANPAISALGFIGGLLTPILLRNSASDAVLAFAFVTIVQTTAIFIAIRQGWRILIPIIAPLSTLSVAFLLEPRHHYLFVGFALFLSIAHFVAFVYAKQPAIYVVAQGALLLAGLRTLDLALVNKNAVREIASGVTAGYGIALLAYGLARTSAVNRMLGLVLLGLVIAKLYLIDVWVLARVYRITAFVGLGALLLIASYIYSRSDRRTMP